MRTNIGAFGVTEGQLIAIFMIFGAAVTGQKIDDWYLADFIPKEKLP